MEVTNSGEVSNSFHVRIVWAKKDANPLWLHTVDSDFAWTLPGVISSVLICTANKTPFTGSAVKAEWMFYCRNAISAVQRYICNIWCRILALEMWFSSGQINIEGKTHLRLISAICFGFCQNSTRVQTGSCILFHQFYQCHECGLHGKFPVKTRQFIS